MRRLPALQFTGQLVAAAMVAAATAAWAADAPPAVDSAAQEVPEAIALFNAKIEPVLKKHCIKCHSGPKAGGDLRLDTRQGVRQGGVGADDQHMRHAQARIGLARPAAEICARAACAGGGGTLCLKSP